MTPEERTNLEAETADRRDPHADYVAGRDPNFWLWTDWHDHGALPSERPKLLPRSIPKWKFEKWEIRYKLHRGAKRPPAPSAFGGKGLFTAHDPGVVLRKRPAVDWVAVTLDKFNGVPGCSATMAAQLRVVGYRLFAWEARATLGFAATVELGATGYIGQAESEGELEACMGLAFPPTMTKALVGNPTAWKPDAGPEARARGWELVLEHYRNEQPWLQPDSRGYPVASYCFGCYPGQAGRVYLSDYLLELPTGSWSAYLAEELDDLDWETIGRKP